jgi:lon-related putative ATP-dependent protease
METSQAVAELRPHQLSRRLDPATLLCASTATVDPLEGTMAQPRAVDALEFGLEMSSDGYNVFVAGHPGSGRESTVLNLLRRLAPTLPPPSDYVYVYNFVDVDRPNAIRLPQGWGVRLARDMQRLIQRVRQELPRAFDSEDYERRQRALLGELADRRDAIFEELERFARSRNYAIQLTPAGVVTVPIVNGQPIPTEAFAVLAEPQRAEIEQRGKEVRDQVADTMRRARLLERETAERITTLDREVSLFVVGPLIEDLLEEFASEQEVAAYLRQVQDDVLANYREFRTVPGADPAASAASVPLAQFQAAIQGSFFARYEVNVLIDNSSAQGAPVIVERHATFYNLIGRMDYHAALGALVTDFRQIKPGALHRANGGFLVLDATDVLRQPFAWESLKRALLTKSVQIESMGEQYSPVTTATLRPEPISLAVKVILIGEPQVYHLLYAADEEFREYFRVKADFAPDMHWTDINVCDYLAFISRQVKELNLRHLDREALARMVEEGARLVDHQAKLSARMLDIATIVTEASYWAGKAGHDLVTVADVERAIAAREERSNLLEERLHERIMDGSLMIETHGERVGEVNGIAVLDLGDHRFGVPTRISARVALGRGELRSIERDIELSGPIHSKGFLILTGYLTGRYGAERPLAASATLTFEQSYDEIEGDSASSAELYALLSALSELPLKQSIGVTGSVDQHGRIQAVGGVNQKVEGFFSVCKARGLTGEQGVLIPAANVQHLMLRAEVRDAVAAGLFHVWAIHTIDEGMLLLTGREAGAVDEHGRYPDGSVHQLVAARLDGFAAKAREFSQRMEPMPNALTHPN